MLWQTRRTGLCFGVSNTFRRMLSSLFLLASWSTIWSLTLNETFLLCEMVVIIFLILTLMFGLLKPSIRPKANLFMNCLRKFLSWRRLSFKVICPHIGILLILFANSTINEGSLIYEIRISNDKFPCCSKWQSWWSCSELYTNEKSPQECSFSLPKVVFLTLPDIIQWCWWIIWSCGRWRTQGRWWSGL